MAAHSYWRFNWLFGNGGANIALAEVEMRTSVGGSNAATGGTAGGTSVNGSFPAANAFDANISTDYQSTAILSTLSYQFASPVDIVEYALTASASLNINLTPQRWQVEYSDDGAAWTIAGYARSQSTWATGEVKTFGVAASGRAVGGLRQAVQSTPPSAQVLALGKAPATAARTVSGTVKVEGTPTGGLLVRAYAKPTGEYIGQATSAGDGSYSINCGNVWADVYVVAFDPTTYQAVVFDQIVPG
ncbi:hypothetical protein [Cupriavidus necator]